MINFAKKSGSCKRTSLCIGPFCLSLIGRLWKPFRISISTTIKIIQAIAGLISYQQELLKVVRNKQLKFFSHRYLIEFHETNRMSHVPHLYDIVILLK